MSSYKFIKKELYDYEGYIFCIYKNNEELSYRNFIELLKKNNEFIEEFNKSLYDHTYKAICWEVRPVNTNNLDEPIEYVILKCTFLASLPPDTFTFKDFFTQEQLVVSFDNLGGDARLIAPCPQSLLQYYIHLSVYAKHAPSEQILKLWKLTASELEKRISNKNTWLNTAGHAVAWLHIRLDSFPKYYSYSPFKKV